MSKYQKLYDVVGRPAEWNDKTKTGRVLKWELDTYQTPKKVRDEIAHRMAKRLAAAGITVQKVQVRNSVTTRYGWIDGVYRPSSSPSYDKLSVYIDSN